MDVASTVAYGWANFSPCAFIPEGTPELARIVDLTLRVRNHYAERDVYHPEPFVVEHPEQNRRSPTYEAAFMLSADWR
jgi:hypothetical protein